MSNGDQRGPLQLKYPKLAHYFTHGVIILLALKILGLILVSYAPNFTVTWLALHPAAMLRGHIWRLVTYSFVNCGAGVVWGGLGIILCGSAIEREWRTKSFLFMWLVIGVASGVIWTIVGLVVGIFKPDFFQNPASVGAGSASCVYGMLGAFAMIFRRQKVASFFFIMEAQHLILVFVGVGLVLSIPNPMTFIWVAGAGVGYLYVKLRVGGLPGISGRAAPKAGRFDGID